MVTIMAAHHMRFVKAATHSHTHSLSLSLSHLKNCFICEVWCFMLYWAFSAFFMSESSLSRWDSTFALRSTFLAVTGRGLTSDSCSASASSSAIGGSSASCCWPDAVDWSDVDPDCDWTRAFSKVPKLPQTVCKSKSQSLRELITSGDSDAQRPRPLNLGGLGVVFLIVPYKCILSSSPLRNQAPLCSLSTIK
jgi:hypothetical protein